MSHRYDAESTRYEILNIAADLFIQQGYEKTSINQIVKKLDGLTKGAVYHHFESKEAILNDVIALMLPDKTRLHEIEMNKSLTGLEQLQQLFLFSMHDDKLQTNSRKVAPLMENPAFFLKHLEQTKETYLPFVLKFIQAGNKDQSLHTAYPKQVSEVALFLLNTWYMNALYSDTVNEFWDKVAVSQFILQQLGVNILADDVINQIKQLVGTQLDGVKDNE
ncbi:TetR/AcrR family transcriptional regulator [Vagococcus vulneris]|uniref:HTH tetR-type domain-containing protein n=1 Tax=Vagococcus vulneris TaxID=1977869 RepID=A0A429ZQ94_9ENTE|nr:TetR/AcrR family transcriptional regulator [Vagococcus vulneris]RST95809.1 hypothetical protein CBF37_11355 [Vagococcus vulneris]